MIDHYTPPDSYDKRHIFGYNHNQEAIINIHPHALHTHGLTREQIITAFVTRIGPARIRERDHTPNLPDGRPSDSISNAELSNSYMSRQQTVSLSSYTQII